MNKVKKLTPDELFDAAVAEVGPDFTLGSMRILLSGLALLQSTTEKRLNKIELGSISSMVSYAAYTQDVDEATIMAVLSSHFDVEDIRTISSRHYDEVIIFLLYLKIAEIIN